MNMAFHVFANGPQNPKLSGDFQTITTRENNKTTQPFDLNLAVFGPTKKTEPANPSRRSHLQDQPEADFDCTKERTI